VRAPEPAPPSQRILLAEDDPETAALLRVQMSLTRLDADVVADGISALAHYEAARASGRPYALLVLDLAMPGLSGLGVADAVRARGDSETRIAFLTADDSTFSRARAQLVRPVAFLVKPSAIVELPAFIRQVLA